MEQDCRVSGRARAVCRSGLLNPKQTNPATVMGGEAHLRVACGQLSPPLPGKQHRFSWSAAQLEGLPEENRVWIKH